MALALALLLWTLLGPSAASKHGMALALALLLWTLLGPSAASKHGDCQKYRRYFERVYSVPGDVAMLNSTLLSPAFFNLSAGPFAVAWYRQGSDRPIADEPGRVLVRAETLWLLNVTLDDAGDYVTVVSTPGKCYRQETELVVDSPLSLCGRPRTSGQRLTKGVTDRLACPLKDYIHKLSSYGLGFSITWFKGCEQVPRTPGRLEYWETFLKVKGVESGDQGLYTCTLSFSLGGVNGSVSETIDAEVKGDYYLLPQVREPANDVIRADLGGNLTKRCLVFVPCEGNPLVDVDVYWMFKEDFISSDASERVHATPQRLVQKREDGVWMETWLIFSELQDDDFNQTYVCKVWSGRGSLSCYFTLLRTDPELLVPVGLGLGSCLLLLLLCASVHHVFKVDLALWTRGTFPGLYPSTARDGKLYDAYVAFPPACGGRCSDLERFALQTLPQVLEDDCGFSLFIPGRDCLPGQAVVDSVEENLQASRRILLLYGASTFSKRYCTSDNNNTLLSRPLSNPTNTTVSKDHLNTSMDHLNTSKDHLNTSMDHLNTSKDHLNTSKDHLNTSKDHLNTSKDHLNTSKDHLNTSKDHLNTSKDHLNTSMDHLNTSMNHLNTSKDHLNTSKDHLNTNNNPESISLKVLGSDKELLSSVKVEGSWDPHGELGCGQDMCGHARAQLECVAAMHRALLERSLKVILVELEELGPSDVERLPESVRHLRQTQGAVRWWKSQRRKSAAWWTPCARRSQESRDVETPLSNCTSPNSRFWKEVRYRMPV